MKVFLLVMAGALILVSAMAAWSIGARMMNQHDDMSVIKGVLVIAGVLGLAGAGVFCGVKSLRFPSDDKEGAKKGS